MFPVGEKDGTVTDVALYHVNKAGNFAKQMLLKQDQARIDWDDRSCPSASLQSCLSSKEMILHKPSCICPLPK